MAIKKPIPITFNLDSHNSVQSVCAVIHIDDKNTETLDLSLMQGGEHIAVSPNSTVTARFVRVKNNTLISDDIACTVQENGNIYIPIDNAAAHMLVGEIKIEVNIVDENDILTMQFPLVIKVNNTILADAEISPESEGTIPELLEEAREAAEDATQAAEAATEAISTKQDKLTAGENITIEDNVISATGGGVTDYNELENKPQINGVTLSGNKTSDGLNLQDKLTAGQNITIDEDNVISAEGGGVTSYNDLMDKPTVYSERSSSSTPLTGELTFSRQFGAGRIHENDPIYIEVRELARGCLEKWSNYFVGNQLNINAQYSDMYDFNNLGPFNHAVASYPAGFYNCVGKNLRNTPQVFSDSISDYTRVVIMHYNTIISLITRRYMLRTVYFQDSATNKVRQFAQWIYYDTENNPVVHAVTDWCEIGGGSQIVSGVVNANGTITFTDSDGSTFTTTGQSVIGPQGDDYVLTAQDKSDIADIVLSELPTTQGVLYGNQSN